MTNEPVVVVDDSESPSGKSLLVRGTLFHLSVQNGLTDAEWQDKLQAKANYFAALVVE